MDNVKIAIISQMKANVLYFGLFFLLLSAASFVAELPLFFSLFGISQALLEVSLLLFISFFLQKWAPKWLFSLFIIASFVLLLVHFTQITVARVMDTGIGYILSFFFGSGLTHTIVGFQALNLNWIMVLFIFIATLTIPLLGLLFYNKTSKFSLTLTLRQITTATLFALISFCALDFAAYSTYSHEEHCRYKKPLPFGTTLFAKADTLHPLQKRLSLPKTEPEQLPKAVLEKKPNLYFFIIETFRKDFLTAAPNLTAFGKSEIDFASSHSNANSTCLSWFSLFYGDLPFEWAHRRDHWKEGAVPLRYLKSLGYKIHAYSSADLRYFHMDEVLFGENAKLLDYVEEYASNRAIEPWERDALAFSALKRDLQPDGHVYLIFLDGTHSEYSFPKNAPLRFTPIIDHIDYLTIGPTSPQMEGLKNRYRNAIAQIDDQFGSFFDTLKKQNLYETALIIITGDHGEEFFEEGALFHGTHLNHYQTSVPLLLKAPLSVKTDHCTHIDIFPSLLHALTKEDLFSPLCDGKSVFSEHHKPPRIAALPNGANTPNSFSLESSNTSLRAKVIDPTHLEVQEGSIDEAELLLLRAPE